MNSSSSNPMTMRFPKRPTVRTGLPTKLVERRFDRAQQKRRLEANLCERLADDRALERLDVDRDVR